jgi:hypothetical protein
LAVHDRGYLARSPGIGQHGFDLLAIFDDIDVLNGPSLFGKSFPSRLRKGSGVFTEDQDFAGHAASSQVVHV